MSGSMIPWAVHALAAEEYNKHYDQSAERLAERGGFDWAEVIACLRGDYTHEGCTQARKDLVRILGFVKESNGS